MTEINATINVIVQNIMDASEQMSKNYKFIEQMAHNSEEVEAKIINFEPTEKRIGLSLKALVEAPVVEKKEEVVEAKIETTEETK